MKRKSAAEEINPDAAEFLKYSQYGSTKGVKSKATSTSTRPPTLGCHTTIVPLSNIKDLDSEKRERARRGLVLFAYLFRNKKYIGPEEEVKYCIWPGSDEPVTWKTLSCGYSWIGVYNGTDIACVVALSDPISGF